MVALKDHGVVLPESIGMMRRACYGRWWLGMVAQTILLTTYHVVSIKEQEGDAQGMAWSLHGTDPLW